MRALELYSEVSNLSGNNDRDLFLTALNDSIAYVLTHLDISNAEYSTETTPGVGDYRLPENISDVLAVYIDGVPAKYSDYSTLRQTTNDISGNPELAIWGLGYSSGYKWAMAVDDGRLYIVLSPIPQSKKTLLAKCKEIPPKAKSLEQEIKFPEFARNALLQKTLFTIYQAKGDPRSAMAEQMYLMEIRNVNAKYGGVSRLALGGRVRNRFIEEDL